MGRPLGPAGEGDGAEARDAATDRMQDRLVGYLRRAGLAAGEHVPEQAVADALGVSRTPARRMLAALEEIGILASVPNRGYFMQVASAELFEPAIDLPATDDATLFDRITLDRLSGDIPDTFAESEIAARYGVSRRMTERVMADLRAEGLTEPLGAGRHRFNQTLLSAEASDASYLFRLTVETAIPLLPGFSVEAATLARMRETHERFLAMPEGARSNRVAYRIDADFHETIAAGAHNAHFLAAVVQQNRLRQLMEYRDYNNTRRVEGWCHEHLAIIDALEAGDGAAASALIAQHLRNAMAYRPRRDRSARS